MLGDEVLWRLRRLADQDEQRLDRIAACRGGGQLRRGQRRHRQAAQRRKSRQRIDGIGHGRLFDRRHAGGEPRHGVELGFDGRRLVAAAIGLPDADAAHDARRQFVCAWHV
ncbi:MAG: hypothetical protein WDM81_13735 [Rhizomicrobium sp.]